MAGIRRDDDRRGKRIPIAVSKERAVERGMRGVELPSGADGPRGAQRKSVFNPKADITSGKVSSRVSSDEERTLDALSRPLPSGTAPADTPDRDRRRKARRERLGVFMS